MKIKINKGIFLKIFFSIIIPVSVTLVTIFSYFKYQEYSRWVKMKPQREVEERRSKIDELGKTTLNKNLMKITNVEFIKDPKTGNYYARVYGELPNGFTIKRIFTRFETKEPSVDGKFYFDFTYDMRKISEIGGMQVGGKNNLRLFASNFINKEEGDKYKLISGEEHWLIVKNNEFAEGDCFHFDEENIKKDYCLYQDLSVRLNFNEQKWCFIQHQPKYEHNCVNWEEGY